MKKLLLFIGVFAAVSVAFGLKAEQASAAVCPTYGSAPTYVFPRNLTGTRENAGCGDADSFIWMSAYHAGSPLETRTATLRVFFRLSDIAARPDPIDQINFFSPDSSRVRCGFSMDTFYYYNGGSQSFNVSKPGGTCAWPTLFGFVPGSFSVYKSQLYTAANTGITKYGNNLGWVDIRMQIPGGVTQTNAPFKVWATQGGSVAKITFAEQRYIPGNPGASEAQISGNYVTYPTNTGYGGATGAMALWTNDLGGGTQEPITYTLQFAPDCNVAPGANVNVYFKWYDADGPTSGTQPYVFTSYIIDDTTGSWVWASDSNGYTYGGDNSYNQVGPITITGGHRYRWQWATIARNNGVQVVMPFSEMSSDPAAVCAPTDVCPNIAGNQASVPAGYYQQGGNCYTDVATCLSASIVNIGTYPGNQYRITVSWRNDGNSTWSPGTFNAGTRNGVTNNYISNGNASEPRMTWSGGAVGPGGTATFTYTTSLPSYGNTYPSNWSMVHEGRAWFGPQCGMNFTVSQGRVGDAYNWGVGRSSTINTCSMGSIGTDANGFFTFVVPQGWAYCVRATPAGVSPTSIFVRPFAAGYRGCAANALCTAEGSYENQVAGSNPANGFDRTIDYGYDLALAWAPTITCSVNAISALAGFPFTPSVSVTAAGPAVGTAASPVGGTIAFSMGGQGASGNISPTLGVPGTSSYSLSSVTVPAGSYNATASAAWTAGPYSGNQPCTPQNGVQVGDQPYYRVFGGDVSVGSGLEASNGTCSAAGAGRAYGFTAGSAAAPTGAGVDFALTALGAVSGLPSSRGNTANAPNGAGLTFASRPTASISYPGALGGNFGNSVCRTNYTATKKSGIATFPGGATVSTNLASLRAAAATSGTDQVQYTGDMTLTGGSLAAGQKLAVYITGNLYITQPVTLATAYASSNDIPFLAIIVTGNIFVAPGPVGGMQLDGLYVAQESGANTGGFYTCSGGIGAAGNYGTGPGGSALHTNCARKLTVNGAVIAKRMKLQRTNGQLYLSATNDPPASANIAEVFNNLPEMYMTAPPFRVDPTTEDQYDNASTLAPIL